MRLTPEQQKLVEENHDLIYHMLNYHRLNHEDYYDIAAIGLCKAALIFKKPKKVQFSTFACHVINKQKSSTSANIRTPKSVRET